MMGCPDLTCHSRHRLSKPFALCRVGKPFFRFVVEMVSTTVQRNLALLGETRIRQAAIKLVNNFELVPSLHRSMEALLMTKQNRIDEDPDHRFKIVSWFWYEIELRRHVDRWVYGRQFHEVELVRAFRRGMLTKSAVPYDILTSEGLTMKLKLSSPFGVLLVCLTRPRRTIPGIIS